MEEQEKSNQKRFSEERCLITLILIFVALIISFSVFIFGFSGFPIKDYLMIFSAGIIGSALRAKFLGKDGVNKTIKDLRSAYYFIYPIVIFATSFIILSTFYG
ncbi:hypothetical protein A2814_00065 [Candidatus Nomurabacteria bacterium RIFCSPHIGHO2_01_FULL_38_19]|uniref:Uncharacterized protein n=1 Tax=Candidatus Nomurabacteria bacterium RIFCSPHIGHO2_01_FULL_38_19 TaxID=1801732 RepID=A0A1F6UTX3_9BACT|nr:MAG: hypothetical protein A2814_00065 [Candidatus Nomurabacteria bacterium RIFCSPHIGHO2_01_FULL_38_19]